MPSSIVISTHLAASADDVWDHVGTPRLLHFVTKPILAFRPKSPASWPERWEPGEYLCTLYLFGLLPIGDQIIGISFPKPKGDERYVRDNGRSSSIRRWDHVITIRPEGDGCYYEDRLDLDAGWRTPVIAAFARFFYSHRQSRWRKLAASGFRYEDAA